MLEERGKAFIMNGSGHIVPVGRTEEVIFVPADFRDVVNGDDVRFWRFPHRRDRAQFVVPLRSAFDTGRLFALASAGAGLTPSAASYLELQTVKMLFDAHAAADQAQTRQRLEAIDGALARVGAVRAAGAAPLGVRTVRKVLARARKPDKS
jgi:hypothetical protein